MVMTGWYVVYYCSSRFGGVQLLNPLPLKIVGMQAVDNNRASTVLQLFLEATRLHGCPSRCRGDRGGENLAVAMYMTLVRGMARGSFMWGSYVLVFF